MTINCDDDDDLVNGARRCTAGNDNDSAQLRARKYSALNFCPREEKISPVF